MQNAITYESLLYHAFPPSSSSSHPSRASPTPKLPIDPLPSVFYTPNNANPVSVFLACESEEDRHSGYGINGSNYLTAGEDKTALRLRDTTTMAQSGYDSLLDWMENNFQHASPFPPTCNSSSGNCEGDSLPQSVNMSAASSSSSSSSGGQQQQLLLTPNATSSTSSEADSSFSMDFSSLFESTPTVTTITTTPEGNFDWSLLTEDNLNSMLNEFYPSLATAPAPTTNTTFTNNPQPVIPTIAIPAITTTTTTANNSNDNANTGGIPYHQQQQQQPTTFFNNAARVHGFGNNGGGSYSTPSSQWNSSPYCRPISPMSGLSTTSFGSGEELDERERKKHRRETHNLVERKRRDQMNLKIQELSALIPISWLNRPDPTTLSGGGGGVGDGGGNMKPNKSMILDKSVEYIHYLQKLIANEQKKNAKLEQLVMELQQSHQRHDIVMDETTLHHHHHHHHNNNNNKPLNSLDESKKHSLE